MLFNPNLTDNEIKQEQELFEQKHNEYKDDFFKSDKEYVPKKLMTISEATLFHQIIELFTNKFYVFPQISLRSIIHTPTFRKTSKELYRTIDIVLFDDKFIPKLAIELHGKEHKKDYYTINRDVSNEQILNQANIPLLTLWTDKYYEDKELSDLIKEKINTTTTKGEQ